MYVVPQVMRKVLVIHYHDMASNFGFDNTVSRIKQFYYFPRKKGYVKWHKQNCFVCYVAKLKSGCKERELHPIPPGRRPFKVVHVDHFGSICDDT